MKGKEKSKRVVIIGVGFGGLTLAKKLRHSKFEVLIVDRNNYHTFQPLLYQVATGGLEPDSIAFPVRRIFRNYKNVFFRMAEAKSIEIDKKLLNTSIGKIYYDYLVIASGSKNNFYNFEAVKGELLSLKSVVDALDIRSFIMQNLEKALVTKDPDKQEEIINITIVGGGPAGLEIAGALAEMKKYIFPKDFPELDLNRMHIYLFEANPRLISSMSEHASEASLKYLKKMGVIVHLNTRVENYDSHKLQLHDKSEVYTDTVIWTAGVQSASLKGMPFLTR